MNYNWKLLSCLNEIRQVDFICGAIAVRVSWFMNNSSVTKHPVFVGKVNDEETIWKLLHDRRVYAIITDKTIFCCFATKKIASILVVPLRESRPEDAEPVCYQPLIRSNSKGTYISPKTLNSNLFDKMTVLRIILIRR